MSTQPSSSDLVAWMMTGMATLAFAFYTSMTRSSDLWELWYIYALLVITVTIFVGVGWSGKSLICYFARAVGVIVAAFLAYFVGIMIASQLGT